MLFVIDAIYFEMNMKINVYIGFAIEFWSRFVCMKHLFDIFIYVVIRLS